VDAPMPWAPPVDLIRVSYLSGEFAVMIHAGIKMGVELRLSLRYLPRTMMVLPETAVARSRE